jgi:hypothetical protein
VSPTGASLREAGGEWMEGLLIDGKVGKIIRQTSPNTRWIGEMLRSIGAMADWEREEAIPHGAAAATICWISIPLRSNTIPHGAKAIPRGAGFARVCSTFAPFCLVIVPRMRAVCGLLVEAKKEGTRLRAPPRGGDSGGWGQVGRIRWTARPGRRR